jgi:sterol 3beta-glucosyltransferase
VLTGGWLPLASSYQQLARSQADDAADQMQLVEGPVLDHVQLLEDCQVLLSHGGSGTVAAAFAAGIPMVLCPRQFDQFYWVRCACIS